LNFDAFESDVENNYHHGSVLVDSKYDGGVSGRFGNEMLRYKE
jgi:hypothetical protein